MRAKVVQLCSEVDNETNVNKEEEIDLECAWQDPIGPLGKQNLIQQGNWYSLPNPIWFQLHSMLDARARLFDYIGRRTLGFPGKNTKLSQVAMPWPGNGEIAQLIGVSRGDNVSTLKKQLQRSGMIVVWKEPETKKEWVGINPTLFHIPPIVSRFLGQYCGKYDYRTIRWIVNVRKSYDDKSFKVLRFALYFFKECTLEIQSLDFKNLKCSKDGQLFLHGSMQKKEVI